jgi:uncharacterized protein (DUF433 family)
MTSENHELQYIESNPLVCHGKWVFRGTRIMVRSVLEQLDAGVPRDVIVQEWRGDVSLAAIEEVVCHGPGLISAEKRSRSRRAA